ncbi:MAG: hypothetical protein PHN56_00235 [Candidatus Nanoarchaeia archaeon]|jgi:ribosomal protein S24E|nr:hypothetical protein [Candidatus Nanoarchaeia archaeon]
MKLINKKEDKLTNKIIYELEMDYKGQKTPDRKAVLEMVNKELRIEKNLMVIKKIDNIYGKESAKVIIHAYKDRQDLEKNEPKYLIKRVTFKEDEKKEEVKA